jgi:oligoendopeptidase F
MREIRSFCVPAVLTALLITGFVPRAHAVERSEIPEKHTWNLADLYPNEAAWKKAREDAAGRITDFAKYQNRVAESAGTLSSALRDLMAVDRQVNQLANYASQLNDQDTRVARGAELRQITDKMRVDLQSAASFVRPEILAAGAEKIRSFVASEPGLAELEPYLENILRFGPHTLGPAEEKIAADAGVMADTGQSTYATFTNADLPYPEVTLSNGTKVRLDAAAYTKYRASGNREDRIKVFQAFFGQYRNFERTLGTTLAGQVQSHIFSAKVHKFDSSLQASLFRDNIPTKVYTQLIADVHANLGTLHRYLKLRKKMMGVAELRYEDLYAPIVKSVSLSFTPEKALDLTLQASAPLGEEYVSTLRKGYENRWVDLLPSTGKRSGAYSQDTYGVHPYQLLNFVGGYEDVSTLAHESGHSMHSYISDQHQPYVTHDYATFVAEVASTVNENLLLHHMLRGAKDDATRLFLLGSYLDNLRTTLFRQTLFAEFEMRIHEMAEKGEPLTGEGLTKLYLALVKEYYGDAEGICKVDDAYGIEWSYIPHFYYNFYVYQYATSVIASVSLAQGILEEAPSTRRRDAYLRMLGSGSSKYPVDLLKDAGVDMTTSAPFSAAMKEMNRIMDEMERLQTP